MDIRHFNDLLAAARQQAEPQRLLLVFVVASLPPNASAAQRASFEAGESGELAPLACVDKDPAEWPDFAALQAEASAMAQGWALVFAAALSGQAGQAPTPTQVEAALQRMVDAVKSGQLSGMVPFGRDGEVVHLG